MIASELSKYMQDKHLNVGLKRVCLLLNEICLILEPVFGNSKRYLLGIAERATIATVAT